MNYVDLLSRIYRAWDTEHFSILLPFHFAAIFPPQYTYDSICGFNILFTSRIAVMKIILIISIMFVEHYVSSPMHYLLIHNNLERQLLLLATILHRKKLRLR